MVLRDLQLQRAYRSGRDAPLDEFYVPCLQEAIKYERAVGYFSSSLYHVAAIAFSDFVRRGGRMRLICSPALSPADYSAMREGEMAAWAQEAVRDDLAEMLEHPSAIPATRLLATLIASGILEVRIAFADNPAGLFHDKLGIFEDSDGRRVSFNGSANETWRAWGLNHESFEVFCSWASESDLLRTRDHAEIFRSIWSGREPGIRTARLDEVTTEHLREIAEDDVDLAIDAVRSMARKPTDGGDSRPLMEHQRLVLDDWQASGHRGIVNFATGAGKTLTAIEAIRRWTANGGAAVVLVPSSDLHEQWIREIESEIESVQILPAGAGSSKPDWMMLLPAFTAQGNPGERRVVVVTNATFASEDFQRRLRSGDHLLVVVDEMHRAGSSKVLPVLEDTECGGALGLSATYQRQFDESGTSRLVAFFGRVLLPVIGLAEALMLGLLVPYDYRLHEVSLDDDEQLTYDDLTKRIRRLAAQGSTLDDDGGPLRHLLIRRARVLKQARQKVPRAVEILAREYREGDRWLVYCDDLEQLSAVVDSCLSLGLPALEFHSSMQGERAEVLRSLAAHGGIVVAIRCLDEGIDVPVTDHALILASSTVEREYVQRRGRVLRRAPGTDKVSAEVHDLLLVDSIGGALTRGEAIRALEFARLSRNPAARERLKTIVELSADPIDLDELMDEGDDSE